MPATAIYTVGPKNTIYGESMDRSMENQNCNWGHLGLSQGMVLQVPESIRQGFRQRSTILYEAYKGTAILFIHY